MVKQTTKPSSAEKCCEPCDSQCCLYPTLSVKQIQNPNRLWAFPVFGFLIKIIILIPIFIETWFLSTTNVLLIIINSFGVLFTGRYWRIAYELNLGLMRLNTKISFFMAGLTDKYPGFSLSINDNFNVDMEKPKNPNRAFAFPLFGGLVRIILLIPFFIWMVILRYAELVAMVLASFPVLFMGKYPESFFEIIRDYTRVNLATSVYFSGLSDQYPSFRISFNHKKIKITLIIISLVFLILSNWPRSGTKPVYSPTYPAYNLPATTNNQAGTSSSTPSSYIK